MGHLSTSQSLGLSWCLQFMVDLCKHTNTCAEQVKDKGEDIGGWSEKGIKGYSDMAWWKGALSHSEKGLAQHIAAAWPYTSTSPLLPYLQNGNSQVWLWWDSHASPTGLYLQVWFTPYKSCLIILLLFGLLVTLIPHHLFYRWIWFLALHVLNDSDRNVFGCKINFIGT